MVPFSTSSDRTSALWGETRANDQRAGCILHYGALSRKEKKKQSQMSPARTPEGGMLQANPNKMRTRKDSGGDQFPPG